MNYNFNMKRSFEVKYHLEDTEIRMCWQSHTWPFPNNTESSESFLFELPI